jgi:hypothetical protein
MHYLVPLRRVPRRKSLLIQMVSGNVDFHTPYAIRHTQRAACYLYIQAFTTHFHSIRLNAVSISVPEYYTCETRR